jgi:hypothetical protein
LFFRYCFSNPAIQERNGKDTGMHSELKTFYSTLARQDELKTA